MPVDYLPVEKWTLSLIFRQALQSPDYRHPPEYHGKKRFTSRSAARQQKTRRIGLETAAATRDKDTDLTGIGKDAPSKVLIKVILIHDDSWIRRCPAWKARWWPACNEKCPQETKYWPTFDEAGRFKIRKVLKSLVETVRFRLRDSPWNLDRLDPTV